MDFEGTFSLDDRGQWSLLVMMISPSGVELLYPRGTTVVIPKANRFDEVVFIVMETSLSGERRRVNYTLSTAEVRRLISWAMWMAMGALHFPIL